ncbi:calmodulin-binding transcription activator 4-like isoform X2 [Actinidia eriantha]|uniref:calmodulin-binding transcription activator 4-like isoform X2 n=1 Tax=Actinidia eriantha TaxID=165200 RepID=UPI00258374E7|nr:calmodulin-binding transcription activator 4-like isoform X2 [Actinidia eriantha]
MTQSDGSLFLFNKRVLRFFRKDGHSWRKKKDGRTVGEAHERLKVGNVEALNCYYAHGEQNPDFQRRSYWMLDPECEHIVLVHYREISEGKHSSGSISQLSPGSLLTFSQSPSSHTAQHPGSATAISELYDPYQSPGSVEISSDAVANSNGMDHLDMIERKGESNGSSELEFSQALRRLEEQLSLNDETLEEIGSFCNGNENLNDSESIINGQSEFAPSVDDLNTLLLQQQSGGNRKHNHQGMAQQFIGEHKNSLPWKEKMGLSTSSPGAESEENNLCTSSENGILLSYSRCDLLEEQETGHWINFGTHDSRKCNDFPTSDSDANLQFSASSEYPQSSENPFTLPTSMFLSQEVDLKFPAYSPVTNTHHTDSDYFTTLFDKGQIGVHLEADSSLTIAQQQKFTIREISPDWGYASEATKVVIVGSFLCDPSEGAWTCMFGDREVPVQIIQEGVICCLAPPHLPGKVTLCITSGNQESCSEVREFDYRAQTSSCAQCSSPQKEITKSPEELLAFVRFAQMLLSDPSVEKGDMTESGLDQWGKFKAGEDSWNHVFEALLVGSWTSSSTTDWLLQELLKDKLQQWLSSRSKGGCDEQGCSLSKKEQGVIHMIAGMGFEWALNPILSSGVSINFRDINGWTALHWAAHFGREKMVAALIASGASAGAVTDPNSLDRTGKTPASVAASSGHKGLAGYLSEVALTSHLTSLTLQEKELSKGSPDVEAEIDVINFVQRNIDTNEDQHSLKDTLAAVRNAAQAAARIQAAFRAHSFRRRQQKEDASDAASSVDEYNILSNDIHRLSVASKLAFRNPRDYNTAALSIQKKFRGWKGRKDFLAFRQKVVKIQAHVRGHRVRKQYKVICWAVGVLEKVVLRWRRKGAGLRGFRQEMESIDESEDEDIIKVFRKQKVEGAIDEAFSRVLSMVDSPDARQQYSRVLGRYRQAKAELEGADSDVTSTSQSELFYMENVDAYQHP